ncbi:hypothetical protein [Sphingomonas sp. URHD0057]|uniref:hypothetical protein n=1 Tax=Sphingomonas sp. URHD0057 TaxID=1380389 RepID=UPI00048A7E84|nr:hypothetical protein [Sphingomonas sp. URHD0057]
MGILDGLLGQFGESDVANLGAKLGLSTEHVEMAVKAFDTAEGAAAETGLPVDKLKEIIGQIGGEGSLGQYASMLQGGNLGDIASNLLGDRKG